MLIIEVLLFKEPGPIASDWKENKTRESSCFSYYRWWILWLIFQLFFDVQYKIVENRHRNIQVDTSNQCWVTLQRWKTLKKHRNEKICSWRIDVKKSTCPLALRSYDTFTKLKLLKILLNLWKISDNLHTSSELLYYDLSYSFGWQHTTLIWYTCLHEYFMKYLVNTKVLINCHQLDILSSWWHLTCRLIKLELPSPSIGLIWKH